MRRLATCAYVGALVAVVVAWTTWQVAWTELDFPEVPWLTLASMACAAVMAGARSFRLAQSKRPLPPHRQLVPMVAGGTVPAVSAQYEVRSVASVQAGAGKLLLEEVCREADTYGWALTLDAANDKLAQYYTALGFVRVGPAALMPFGESVSRMVRLPGTTGAT